MGIIADTANAAITQRITSVFDVHVKDFDDLGDVIEKSLGSTVITAEKVNDILIGISIGLDTVLGNYSGKLTSEQLDFFAKGTNAAIDAINATVTKVLAEGKGA